MKWVAFVTYPGKDPLVAQLDDRLGQVFREKSWPVFSGWCDETYGPDNWEYHYGRFYFGSEEDALLFRLRWSP